jgi:hypothetical protein
VLELSDCYRRIELEFGIESAEERLNAFHKIDTLIRALIAFRTGLAEEAALYRRRAREAEAAIAAIDACLDHRERPPPERVR